MATTTEEVIIKTDKAVKNVDSLTKSIEGSTKAGEEHSEGMLDSAKDIRVFGVSINSMTAGVKGTITALRTSVTGLKAFKVALAATGIGLILVALGSLVALFKSSQEGTDKLNRAMNVIKFTIDALIKSAVSLGKAVLKIVTGDVINGFKDLKAAVSGVGDQIRRNLVLSGEFSDRQILLEKMAINLVIQQAAYNQKIAEGREILNDTLKTDQERIIAGEKALKAANDLAAVNEFNLLKRIEQLQNGLEASETFREDELEIAVLQAQRIDAETQASRTRMRIQTQLNTLRKTEDQEAVEGMEFRAKKFFTLSKESISLQKAGFVELTEAEIAAANARSQAISENESKLGEQFKGSAIGRAINNTREGITKAIAQGGVFGFLQIPLILAAGFAQVKAIVSSFIPPSVKFAGGGMVEGPSHSQGGVKFSVGGRVNELEGGEAVINRRATAMFRPQLSAMNQAGGGVAFQSGGVIPSGINTNIPTRQAPTVIPVLYKDDLDKVNDRVMVTENRATL